MELLPPACKWRFLFEKVDEMMTARTAMEDV
jgi:hypothetical protein